MLEVLNGVYLGFLRELMLMVLFSASAIADRLGTEFALIHRQRTNTESSVTNRVNGHDGVNGANGFVNEAVNGAINGVVNGASNGHVQDGAERMELLVGDVKDKVRLLMPSNWNPGLTLGCRLQSLSTT
jgi:hypothetical protein